MAKTSFIRLFYIFVLGLFQANFAHAQQSDIVSMNVFDVTPTIVSVEYGDDKHEHDLWFKSIQLPERNISLHISNAEPSADVIAATTLNFPVENISWISVVPKELASKLVDGFILDGEFDGQYLYLNTVPEPLGTIAEIVEGYGEEDILTEQEQLSFDSFDFMSQPQISVPERFININRDSLWRLYPTKLIGQLSHLGVEGAYIKIPSSFNGSFPLNPIELERFVTMASSKGIKVLAIVEDDLTALEGGISKAEVQISELVNYNAFVPVEAQISGVQINTLWSDIESFVFDKKYWFELASDLYAFLNNENILLPIDLLLPQEILDEGGTSGVFESLGQLADSVTIKLSDENEAELIAVFEPLSIWAEENGKSYRIAITRKNVEANVVGWLQPQDGGLDNLANVRMLIMGNWAVLMKVENRETEVGMGFNFQENDLSNVSSRQHYTTDMLELADDVTRWQRPKPSFNGVTLYGLPEFSE